MPQALVLLLDPRDNVAVALEEIPAGTQLAVAAGETLAVPQRIPFAHKLARRRIEAGAAVLKYGVPIAYALQDIAPGEWVHEHNVESYFAAKRQGREA
jgi:altronate hydrolase